MSGKARFGYVYGKTYLEVKKALIERKADAKETPLNIKSGEKETIARYCEKWLTVSRNRVKPSTYAKYRNIILHYIIPHIGARYPESALWQRCAAGGLMITLVELIAGFDGAIRGTAAAGRLCPK